MFFKKFPLLSFSYFPSLSAHATFVILSEKYYRYVMVEVQKDILFLLFLVARISFFLLFYTVYCTKKET